MTTKLKISIYTVLLYFICFPHHAHAYLDPGTGSYIFQVLIAGLLGGMFFFRNAIKRVKNLFKDISSSKESDEDHK
jgi:hypothetical protein